MQSLNSDSSECLTVVGEGADHRTRARVRSPFNCMDKDSSGRALHRSSACRIIATLRRQCQDAPASAPVGSAATDRVTQRNKRLAQSTHEC
jgi:hypothetical protein